MLTEGLFGICGCDTGYEETTGRVEGEATEKGA